MSSWLFVPGYKPVTVLDGSRAMWPFTLRIRCIIAIWCGIVTFAAVLPLPALAQALEFADPASVGLSSERLGRLSRFIRNDIAEGKIPGAVMLVARHGKIAYLEALGMRNKDALFRLGSMTKPITIVAAMTLIEEGRFRLSTPIAQFLPQFNRMQVGIENADGHSRGGALALVPANRPILVMDLLRHTAGFTYETAGEGRVKQLYRDARIGALDESAAERVDKLAGLPLAYQPGTVWEYGRGIDVLGRIIELISGMGLAEFLKARVLDPLHMDDTAYWVPPEKQDRIAAFGPAPPGTPERPQRDITKPSHGEGGGAGLLSTAVDYARFLQMLLNGGQLGGTRLLSRKSVELMTTDQLEPEVKAEGPTYFPGPGYGYGFGFAVRRTLGISGELGSIGDYHIEGIDNNFAFVDPKEQVVAVLMVQAFNWLYYRPMIKDLVLQSIVD
jgi:CubicO group peptidase (beta-lactamase class C family)